MGVGAVEGFVVADAAGVFSIVLVGWCEAVAAECAAAAATVKDMLNLC